MKVKATILCENHVMWDRRLLGEHGFSVFLETEYGNYLFDTGIGTTIVNNSMAFGFDLKTVKGIILSHNHGDHTGGLIPVLDIKEGIEIFAHPTLFRATYADENEGYNDIGLPYTRQSLESRKARFNFSTEFREIATGFWLTGKIPRLTEYETGSLSQKENINQVIKTENGYEIDPVTDDQSIVLETEKGLIVILGCCHSGIINTLNYVSKKMGTRHFHAVIGGTHLEPASEETKEKTINALSDFDIERIGISHCSGLEIMVSLAERFGEKAFYCHLGTVLEA